MSPTELLTHYLMSCTDVDALGLEPLPLPTGEWGVTVEGDDVEYAAKMLHLSDDKRVAIGIEKLGPSTLTGTHIGETLYFIQGRVRCNPEGGEPYELKQGDFAYFPPGVNDVWEIQETYVKLFVIHSPTPLPF